MPNINRLAYQQNDDFGRVCRSKRSEAHANRLRRMLAELAVGGVYMNIPPPLSRKD